MSEVWWVTNHALTKGIIKLTNPKTAAFGVYDNEGYYVSKSHCHKTEAEAKKKAEKMRLERISSLKKTLSRLESTSFILACSKNQVASVPEPDASATKHRHGKSVSDFRSA